MAYNAKAQKKYNQKSKYIQLKFTQNQNCEYNRIVSYCKLNNMSMQGYIKELIKRDLDGKGIAYPTDQIDIDIDTE